jgi:hypothetical protein
MHIRWISSGVTRFAWIMASYVATERCRDGLWTPRKARRYVRRASPFTAVTMDFALAITVIIPRPFVHPMVDGGMGWMTAPVTLPFVGAQPRVASGNVFSDEGTARSRIRVVTHPPALLARLARDEADDGGPIVGRGAVALALIGPSPWRVTGIAMGGAVFPPRSGAVRQPHTRGRASPRLVRSRAGAFVRAGATCAVACVTSPPHGLSARWVPLGRGRAAGGPAWLGVGGSFQRRGWAGAWRSRHTRGNGRPGKRPAAERVGAWGDDSEDRPSPPDAGDAPPR